MAAEPMPRSRVMPSSRAACGPGIRAEVFSRSRYCFPVARYATECAVLHVTFGPNRRLASFAMARLYARYMPRRRVVAAISTSVAVFPVPAPPPRDDPQGAAAREHLAGSLLLFGRDHEKHFLRTSRGSSPGNYLNALAGGFSVTFMIGVARAAR